MPVSNAHLDQNTRVWDGKGFHMLPNAEAEKLAKAGKVQITRNLQSKDLKAADDLVPMDDEPAPKKKRGRPRKKTYETREMKAK